MSHLAYRSYVRGQNYHRLGPYQVHHWCDLYRLFRIISFHPVLRNPSANWLSLQPVSFKLVLAQLLQWLDGVRLELYHHRFHHQKSSSSERCRMLLFTFDFLPYDPEPGLLTPIRFHGLRSHWCWMLTLPSRWLVLLQLVKCVWIETLLPSRLGRRLL